MPQIMLPMSWERASLGFMILPAAKTASILGTRTSRLSMSTRTSANWAPNAFRDNGFCELISSVVVAALLPAGAHYVKAFGTLGADALAASANRDPLAVLFYATDDNTAAITIERLIRMAGFEPWKAGGVAAAGRIEAPGGDLHQYGFNGEVVDINRARSATAGSAA